MGSSLVAELCLGSFAQVVRARGRVLKRGEARAKNTGKDSCRV